MTDILIFSPLYIYGGNTSVVHNSSRPESVLKKKSKSVCHHAVHESFAMGESLAGQYLTKKMLQI